ncbi:MAG: translocation/assembly module TamB domain-containing protein [Pseudomonadota bacterium]
MTENISKKRGWKTWLSVTLIGVFALLAILVVSARIFAMTSLGHGFVEARVEALNIRGQSIKIDGLRGDLLSDFEIDLIQVSDGQGVWLKATNVSADWRYLALISGKLDIDALSAADIDVLRQPILADVNRTTRGNGGSFVRTYALDQIAVDRLSVRAPLSPQDFTGSLSASLDYGDANYAAEIDFASVPAGRDQLSLVLTGKTDTLPSLQYIVESAPGGLIAALARLAPEQSLIGEGILTGIDSERWEGQANMSIDGQQALALNAETTDGIIDLSGSVRPDRHPATPEQVKALGPLEISAQFPITEPLKTGSVSITGDGLEANIRARGKATFNVFADLAAPHRLLRSDGFSVEQLRLEGVVSNLDALKFDGALLARTINQRPYAVATVEGPIALTHSDGRLNGTVNLESSGLRLPQAASLKTATISSTFSYADNTLNLQGLDVSSRLVNASATATMDMRNGLRLESKGRARIDGSLLSPDYLNATQFNWSVTGVPKNALTFSVSGNASVKELTPPLTGPVNYEAQGQFEALSRLNLRQFNVTQSSNRISGQLSYEIGRDLDADLSADVQGFAFGDLSIAQANANLKLKASNGIVTGSGFATADDLTIAKQSLRMLKLTLDNARSQAGLYSLDVNLAADVLEEHLATFARIETGRNSNLIGIKNLKADWGGLALSGDAKLDTRSVEDSTAQFQISGTPIALKQVGLVEASLSIANRQISGDVLAQNVAFDDVNLETLRTKFEGDFRSLKGEMSLDGRAYGNAVMFNGPWEVRDILDEAREIGLEGGGVYGPLDITITQPLNASRTSTSGWLGSGALSVNGGTINFDLRSDFSQRGRLEVVKLPIGPFLQASGRLSRAGTLNGVLQFAGDDGGALTGGGSITLTGLRDPTGKKSDFTLKSRLDLTGDTVMLMLDETGLDDLRFNASFEQAVSVDAQWITPTRQEDEGLRYEVTADGRIGTLADLLLPATLSLDGDLNAQLSGVASDDTISIEGLFQINDGEVLQSTLGLDLIDLNADAMLSDQTIVLSTLNARGRNGGQIEGGGSYAFGALNRSSSQISVRDLVVFDQDLATASISGDLSLHSDTERPIISGDLRIVDASINIENLPSSGPPTLDIDFGDREEKTEETESGIIGLDLNVTSNRVIRIGGRGVDALLSADLHIRNELVDPDVTGTIGIIRGDFSLLGKQFDFQPSMLELSDPLTASELNIAADREDAGFVYSIQVTGTPKRPVIELSSTPELPEDEVLSRVLFGRSPSELTALEAAQLAAAIAQLSGGGGFDLLGGLEDRLGLDTLSVNFDGSELSGVTTGKYLADDVYIEVDTGVDGSPGLSIEWEPLDNIEVEVETVPDEGQSLSVQWKRDFD